MQHLRSLVVGEADVLEPDVAARVGEGDRVVGLADRGLLGQHGPDPLGPGGGRLEAVVQLGELLHRVEQVAQVEQERGQHADFQVSAEHPLAADAEHDHGGGRAQELDPGEEERGQPDGAPVGHPLVVVGLLEAGGGGPLAAERLDRPDPGQRLLELHGDHAVGLPDLAVGVGRPAPPGPGGQADQGGDDQGGQGQLPVHDDQDDRHPDHGDEPGHERDQAVGDQVAHGVDVGGHAGDQPARPLALVVVEREGLEVAEELGPDGEQHPLADPGHRLDLEPAGQELDPGQDQVGQGDPVDDGQVAGHDALVDGHLDQVRHGQGGPGLDEHGRRGQRHQPAVGPDQRPQPGPGPPPRAPVPRPPLDLRRRPVGRRRDGDRDRAAGPPPQRPAPGPPGPAAHDAASSTRRSTPPPAWARTAR